MVTAVHLLNRAPTKALQGMTPYEAWHGKVPQVKHLRTFGCVAYTKDLSQLKKLDDRSCPGIFIGYADGAKAYRVLDPETQRVRVSRDVVFDKSRVGLDQGRRRASSGGRGVRRRARRGVRLRGSAHAFIRPGRDSAYAALAVPCSASWGAEQRRSRGCRYSAPGIPDDSGGGFLCFSSSDRAGYARLKGHCLVLVIE